MKTRDDLTTRSGMLAAMLQRHPELRVAQTSDEQSFADGLVQHARLTRWFAESPKSIITLTIS